MEAMSNKEVELYKEDHFKNYVKEKYDVVSESYLENPNLLKMVYALEWFDINKKNYIDLIKYHPNIIYKDYEEIENLQSQHNLDICVTMALSTLVTNRLLASYIPRRIYRYPVTLLWSSAITYGFSQYVLHYVLRKSVDKRGLGQYLELHYDADAMRADLENVGIKIKARFYDKEEVQDQVERNSKSNQQ